ncbi:hypothetical protein EGI16_10795 [Chryseobacterium sp. G0240]|uniref:hypothetical protein n=1 Tax=Chryseobacterium sp. G0240 TaxID=2487066 RepID=UPI000F456F7B|nr:hypothetical protein [Chryseobacterium sp. G0240]ROI03692.1 hypothetical protein EGI16_10795 [Chryseobacterium sp. G0240]
MNNQTLSSQFLLKEGFLKKESDEEYYESTICSNGPGVTIYVYNNSVSMVIGSSREQKLSVNNENQFSELLQTLKNSFK